MLSFRQVAPLALAFSTVAALVPQAHADTFTAIYGTPALDRWNYPFNPTPGTRIVVLDRPRGKVGVAAAGFFGRINARIDASARAEDVDDAEDEPTPRS